MTIKSMLSESSEDGVFPMTQLKKIMGSLDNFVQWNKIRKVAIIILITN